MKREVAYVLACQSPRTAGYCLDLLAPGGGEHNCGRSVFGYSSLPNKSEPIRSAASLCIVGVT